MSGRSLDPCYVRRVCTVILALNVWPDEPLVIAANRDERLDRPSEPPARRDWGTRPVFPPRDALAGGTWWGLNDFGLFVAITNRFGHAPDGERRSRGLLVVDALQAGTVQAAAAAVMAGGPRRHNPFHPVLAAAGGTAAARGADARGRLVWSDDERLHDRELEPGLHIVTERSLGAGDSGREELVAQLTRDLVRAPSYPGDGALRSVLAHRVDDPWRSVSVAVPRLSYGPRSSTLAKLRAPIRLSHANGPPPNTPWDAQDLTNFPTP